MILRIFIKGSPQNSEFKARQAPSGASKHLCLLAVAFGFPGNSRYGASRFQHHSFHRATATENDVRMVARVQNAVFITFVHGSSTHPKLSRFGQFHAEYALMALTCFKFRILRGPQIGFRMVARGDIVFRTILRPPGVWYTGLLQVCRKTLV